MSSFSTEHSPLKIASNKDNLLLLPGVTLTASAVRPSETIFAELPAREGSGSVSAIGPYTGADDVTLDVEITDNETGTPITSAVQFSGVGNGTFDGPEITGTPDVGEYAAVLEDLGVDSEQAQLQLGDVGLEAIPEGADGNDVCLTVIETAIVISAPIGGLSADWQSGQASQVGEEFNFGAEPLLPNGEIPNGAPRIKFGDAPEVYRHYSKFETGRWNYYLSPTPQRTIATGTTVHRVTGSYTVQIDDTEGGGVTVEQFTGVVTAFDLLQKVVDLPSVLAQPLGVYANDKLPGGQGVVELTSLVKTTAHHLAIERNGSEAIQSNTPRNLLVNPNAPTETIKVSMTGGEPGSERWEVKGPASGLSYAFTAVPYVGPSLAFTIPRAQTEGGSIAQGEFVVTDITFPSGSVQPNTIPGNVRICVKGMALLPRATSKTFVARYVEREEQTCPPCEKINPPPIDPHCAGDGFLIDPTEEDSNVIDPDYQTKARAFMAWLKTAYANNSRVNTDTGEIELSVNDLQIFEELKTIFIDGIKAITDGTEEGSAERAAGLAAWQTAFDDMISDVAPISAALGLIPQTIQAYYEFFQVARFSTEFDPSISSQARDNAIDYASTPPHTFQVGDAITPSTETLFIKQTQDNLGLGDDGYHLGLGTAPSVPADSGHWYLCIAAGTAEIEDQPSWSSSAGTKNTVGNAVFLDMGPRDMETATGKDVTHSISVLASFLAGYRADMDDAQLAASLNPFEVASSAGGGGVCWQDLGDRRVWIVENLGRSVAFTNERYYSHKNNSEDPDRPIPTYEYTFVILSECPQEIPLGTEIHFSIGVAGGGTGGGYQDGDFWLIPVVAGRKRCFQNGVTGDNTHTWRVSGPDGLIGRYAVVNGAELPYTAAVGQEFTIYRGQLPYKLGAAYRWCIEAAQFRYRVDGGAWDGPHDVPGSGVEFTDAELPAGIKLLFESGACPSWAVGDTFSWFIEQPHSPSHLLKPDRELWSFDGSGGLVDLLIDLGSAQDVSGAILALQRGVPEGATVTYKAGTTTDTADFTAAFEVPGELDPAAPLALAFTSMGIMTTLTYRYHRIEITGAGEDAGIGWAWLGELIDMTSHMTDFQLTYEASAIIGGGLNPDSLTQGSGVGGSLAWETMSKPSFDKLLQAWKYSQNNCNQAVVVIPNFRFPEEAFVARFGQTITQSDIFRMEGTSKDGRRHRLSVELAAVIN